MNASEPLMTCRKRRSEVKTGTESLSRDQQERNLFRLVRPPALRWHQAVMQRLSGTWEPSAPMITEQFKQKPCESHRVGKRRQGTERPVVARKSPIKGWSQGAVFMEIGLIVSTGNGRNQ